MRSSILVAAILAAAGSAAMARPFLAGDLVVVQVGSGGAALAATGTPAFLQEFTILGAPVSTTNVPTSASGANRQLTLSGTATSEGFLTLSSNGRYLTMTGYDGAVGSTVVGTNSSATNRVIARIDDQMVIDTTTAIADAASPGNPRSVCSNDGINFWQTTSAGGVRYTTLGGNASTQLAATPTNVRVSNIYAGQLYTSSGSSPFIGVNSVGSGLPTTSGQSATLLVPDGGTTPSPYDYFFSDPNTCYVADDRTIANGGGIQKYVFGGASWSLSYTLTTNLSAGVRGLCGVVDALGNVTLFATTAQSNANQLVTVTDAGAVSPYTVLATAPANTAFRGVDFAPVPAPGTLGLLGIAGLVAARRRR